MGFLMKKVIARGIFNIWGESGINVAPLPRFALCILTYLTQCMSKTYHNHEI